MSEGTGITCEQVRDLLLHGQEQEDHLVSCAACRSFHERLLLVDSALAVGDPRSDPVPQVSRAVMAALLANEDRRLRALEIGLVAAGVASAAFLAGALYWLLGLIGLPSAAAASGGSALPDLPSLGGMVASVASVASLDLGSLSLQPGLTMLLGVLTAVGASALLRVMATEV